MASPQPWQQQPAAPPAPARAHVRDRICRLARCRWLTPEEIASILRNHAAFGFELRSEQAREPPSGTLLLYDSRRIRTFRQDGLLWQRKRLLDRWRR